ncbi:hypothetical protein QUQ16_000174 [Escherichia coli]|nr:hypothetical protein [Escherichia coli]
MTTIKQIKAEAAAQIKAIREQRDAQIAAIRATKQATIDAAEAEAEAEAEEAERVARQEAFKVALEADEEYQTTKKAFAAKHINAFMYSKEGDKSTLSPTELKDFNKDIKAFIKNPLYFSAKTEAYSITSAMGRVTFTFNTAEQRAEYVESTRTVWEKAGITLDLPEEQFQTLWDTYVANTDCPDLYGDYGLDRPFDFIYTCDIEQSRQDAFIDWADSKFNEWLSAN